ncbi:MAG: hypothetical protein JWQ40_2761 [Segetibacter sp.]|nr:hypothetical protein [Segetibacter sp.]
MGTKKIIKLSTPWHNIPYSLTPGGEGIFGDYKFEIDNDCSVCDYWIIWGGVRKMETVSCPSSNVIYVTDEAHELRFYNQKFLQQFPTVFSVRTDLSHSNIKYIHELGIWHFPKSYDEIINPGFRREKSKVLSVVASNLTELPGHKKRFAFTNILIGHFKDDLDVFGKGINPIKDKSEGILPYKYSVAIENSVIPNYFTEKIFECFLTYTMPVYFGCPNIKEFFPVESYVAIDINDYKKSIDEIEEVILNDRYGKNFDAIVEAREGYLNNYYLFPALIKYLNKYDTEFSNGKKSKISIKPERHLSFHIEKNIKDVSNIIFNKIKSLS